MPPRRGGARRLHRSSAAPRQGQMPILPSSHPRHLGRVTHMKILPFVIVALSVVAAVLLVQKPSHGGQAPKIRPMAVAGTFYPADPKELGGMIDGFLSKAAPPPLPDVVALVAPHAGYRSEERRVGEECRSRWVHYH